MFKTSHIYKKKKTVEISKLRNIYIYDCYSLRALWY